MKIQIKGRNVMVTDALHEYAEEKLSRLQRYLQEHHTDEVSRVELELMVEKNKSIANPQVAEATVFTRGPVIRAKESSTDMYASIDLVADKLQRQVKRYRDRQQRKSERHAPPVTQTVPAVTRDEAERRESATAADAVAAGEAVAVGAGRDGGDHPVPGIVKTKQFIIKPMSAEEAAMQMELVGHDFFVFRNAETNDTNVVYRRRDGQYGVIEPAGD
jgi:ribosome hibernation promoting factor